MTKLQRELKQTKPFASLEDVLLDLARTAEHVSTHLAGVPKRADLTTTQATPCGYCAASGRTHHR
jgi:hypothetical protein